MNINIEAELHRQFKSITAALGTDMTTVLKDHIQKYVADNSPTSKKPKGRRQ